MGRTGLLVPPEEPRPLAAALLQLAADPGLSARLGLNGREAALARTWPEAIAELGRLYRGLLGIDHEAVRDAA